MKNYTQIVLLVDRSGSMTDKLKDYNGGIKSFIDGQKADKDNSKFTLVEFDTVVTTVHDSIAIENVPNYTLVPRGGTALLDAIGQTINRVGAQLASMRENKRPEKVVFIILTDGEENSSREFNLDMVKGMTTHQQDVYKWEFVYLGANQDAFSVGGAMGFDKAYNYSEDKIMRVMQTTSQKLSDYKGGMCANMDYSSQQQAEIKD